MFVSQCHYKSMQQQMTTLPEPARQACSSAQRTDEFADLLWPISDQQIRSPRPALQIKPTPAFSTGFGHHCVLKKHHFILTITTIHHFAGLLQYDK